MRTLQRSGAFPQQFVTVFLALSTGAIELHAQEMTAPSVVRAQAEAILSTVIAGQINELHVAEGESFSEGDPLAEIDCAIYRSEAAAIRSESVGALAMAASREALFSRGGSGQLEVDVARAEALAATARAETAELRVGTCTIQAPFDGRVVEHAVNEFEHVEPGQPVLSIVSSGTPDLEIIAPAEWLTWLEPGMRGQLSLEAQREIYSVSISAIAPVVDPVSRTVKLTGTIEGNTDRLLPGMSGLVNLRPDQ